MSNYMSDRITAGYSGYIDVTSTMSIDIRDLEAYNGLLQGRHSVFEGDNYQNRNEHSMVGNFLKTVHYEDGVIKKTVFTRR